MAGVISGPSNKGKSVKNECNDPKINAMALKKEYYQKTALAAAKQQRTSPANVYINRAGRAVPFTIAPISQNNNQEQLPKDSVDIKSIQGLFSWKSIAGYHIPFIIRVINGEEIKFVSVRMAETQLLSSYLHHLHADIYTYTSVRSHFITDSEAKLLNEINRRHNNGIYGKDTFYAGKDYIVRLEDVLKFYTFINVCYNKLLSNITPGRIEKCGFIRINSEAVVPYCLKDGRKYLPLFYFEGETESLRQHAVKLKDWNLAYLMFCCKVQGIKSELYTSDSCTAITFDDIKNFFPPETYFEEYWPAKVVNTNLLINQKSTHVHPSGVWIRAPPENTIPHSLTASAPVMPKSMPVVMNTFQNGWPPNQLVNSCTTPALSPQTTCGYSIASRNQSIAAQCYNAGPQMSQGNSLMNGGSHVIPPPFDRAKNSAPAISNTVSYSNTVPISQCMTTMYNPVPSSSVMSHSNQTQQFYNQHSSNNSQAQQQQHQQQLQQQHQQQLQQQQKPQQEQKIKVQPYSGPPSVHGRLTNTQQRNAIRNVAPDVITLGTEIIDLSSLPSSPAPTSVQNAPLCSNVEWKLKKIPKRRWEQDSTNDAAYKGPQMSQGNSLMNGGSHVIPPPFDRAKNSAPAISNTVSYSNTVPISQCMTTMYNPVPSSSVMSHSNQTQQFYNQHSSNNSQAQQQQHQQQLQQYHQQQLQQQHQQQLQQQHQQQLQQQHQQQLQQQHQQQLQQQHQQQLQQQHQQQLQQQQQPQQEQKIKVQPYSGPPSVHGRLTNTQQRNAIRNVAPDVITLGTEIIDLSSPPSSPAPTSVQNAPLCSKVEWKLKIIPERKWDQDSTNDAAYKIQRVIIDRRMVHCINAKPYIYTDLMVTLEDLIQVQLISFSVSRCAYVLYNNLNITLFCGNSEQVNILQDNRLFRTIYEKDTPMVMLQDITYALPQLKKLLSEQDQQYQSAAGPSKRHRTS